MIFGQLQVQHARLCEKFHAGTKFIIGLSTASVRAANKIRFNTLASLKAFRLLFLFQGL